MLRSHGFSHHFIRAHFAWDPFLHSSSSPSSSPSPSPSPSSSLSSSSAIYIYTPSSVPPKPLPSAIPFTMPATHTHDFCRSSSRRRRPRLLICVKALGSSDRSDGKNGNNGLDGGWDPSFEIEVPADQRPVWISPCQFCWFLFVNGIRDLDCHQNKILPFGFINGLNKVLD